MLSGCSGVGCAASVSAGSGFGSCGCAGSVVVIGIACEAVSGSGTGFNPCGIELSAADRTCLVVDSVVCAGSSSFEIGLGVRCCMIGHSSNPRVVSYLDGAGCIREVLSTVRAGIVRSVTVSGAGSGRSRVINLVSMVCSCAGVCPSAGVALLIRFNYGSADCASIKICSVSGTCSGACKVSSVSCLNGRSMVSVGVAGIGVAGGAADRTYLVVLNRCFTGCRSCNNGVCHLEVMGVRLTSCSIGVVIDGNVTGGSVYL